MADHHPAIAAGNTALITGGASGIGLAVATRLSEAGMRVLLVDRAEDALEEAAASLPGEACNYAIDVSNAGEMEALASEVHEKFGPLSVLMNNAGTGRAGEIWDDWAGWARVLGTNLGGVINGVRFFVKPMLDSGRPGMVVNTGSKQGITQPPGDTAYNISKSGVKALTEGLAHRLRQEEGSQVTAHLLVPGFTYTGMVRAFVSDKPDGAWTPEQVADHLLARVAAGDFYIICPDNETPPEIDHKRFLWHTLDMVENRPALSRWHPDWKQAFDDYMKS